MVNFKRRCSKGNANIPKLIATIAVLGMIEVVTVAYLLLNRGFYMSASVFLLGVSAILGVVLALQASFSLLRTTRQLESYCSIMTDLEDLNRSLREQRHDFKNHVQVVSALLEMDEVEETRKYVGKLSADFRSVGRALRTNCPAVNALLQAKANICDTKGIRFEMDVTTRLDKLPIEEWALCRILGNLIDNAIEAQEAVGVEVPFIRLSMTETDGALLFSVFNNGTAVSEEYKNSIFLPGVSTKGKDRGMGLAIVWRIAHECGGTVHLDSDENGVCFNVKLPYTMDYETSADISGV